MTMSPAEFFLALRGFNTAEWKKWRHTRTVGYTVYASRPRKKNRSILSIYRWLPLPIDKTVQQETGQDKMRAVFNVLKKRLNG